MRRHPCSGDFDPLKSILSAAAEAEAVAISRDGSKDGATVVIVLNSDNAGASDEVSVDFSR